MPADARRVLFDTLGKPTRTYQEHASDAGFADDFERFRAAGLWLIRHGYMRDDAPGGALVPTKEGHHMIMREAL